MFHYLVRTRDNVGVINTHRFLQPWIADRPHDRAVPLPASYQHTPARGTHSESQSRGTACSGSDFDAALPEAQGLVQHLIQIPPEPHRRSAVEHGVGLVTAAQRDLVASVSIQHRRYGNAGLMGRIHVRVNWAVRGAMCIAWRCSRSS